MERADLVQLAHTLRQLQTPTGGEVAAARAAWPSLAGGLPRAAAPALRVEVATAARRAAMLSLPEDITTEGSVTGPAVGLAGTLKSYVRLTQRGWQYLAAALAAESGIATRPAKAHTHPAPPSAGGSPATTSGERGAAPTPSGGGKATAQFLRANSPLYIYSVYDGHYHLSLVGKALQNAYRKLGGAPAFGASLTPPEVEAIARFYSIPSVRLEPHPAPSVVV